MDLRKVLELYEEVESEREVARRLGVSRRQVRRALGRATDGGEGEGSVPHTGGVSQHYKEDGTGTVESRPGARIKTLEQLVNACAIDLTRYRVKQHVINKWETGARDDDGNINIAELFQVKAWLEEKRDELELLRLKEQLIAAMESHAPKYSKIRRKALATSDRYLLQVCPVDLHLGKLAWAPEVHGEHYDTTIACRVLRGAIDDLIARVASYQVERVLLVVGNDLLNADNPQNTTTAGTPQDVDGRYAKVFRRGWELMVETIDRLRGVAPVTVKVVPGNHDEDASFKLGEVWPRGTAMMAR